jgi:hypothetical protein
MFSVFYIIIVFFTIRIHFLEATLAIFTALSRKE